MPLNNNSDLFIDPYSNKNHTAEDTKADKIVIADAEEDDFDYEKYGWKPDGVRPNVGPDGIGPDPDHGRNWWHDQYRHR